MNRFLDRNGLKYLWGKVRAAVELKQDRLTGQPGQMVGFNTAGSAVAQAVPVGIPTGGIIIWSGSTAPAGWALCDGTNGTPDLRDRFVLGAGTSHGIGESGGSETVTLTENNLPKHDHTQQLPNVNTGNSSTGWALQSVPSGNNTVLTVNSSAVNVATGRGTSFIRTNKTGESAPHSNMPPYYTLAYIMKL